jgi:hypothetical protein
MMPKENFTAFRKAGFGLHLNAASLAGNGPGGAVESGALRVTRMYKGATRVITIGQNSNWRSAWNPQSPAFMTGAETI